MTKVFVFHEGTVTEHGEWAVISNFPVGAYVYDTDDLPQFQWGIMVPGWRSDGTSWSMVAYKDLPSDIRLLALLVT